MFVSPPPASTKTPVFAKRSKAYSRAAPSAVPAPAATGNWASPGGGLLPTDPSASHLASIPEGSLCETQPAPVENNFVNAPVEYQDRARTEICKRLLPSSSARSHHSRRSGDSGSLLSDGASSYQSSIFSSPSLATTSTAEASVVHFITEISLQDALPKTFYDMYAPEVVMSDPGNLLCNGRPKFTERALLDWELNDIRSLLIVENLKPEWGGCLPSVISPEPSMPQFRLQLLPLSSSDAFIIETLVSSDLYAEFNLDYQFKLTSAKYTVAAARKRHEHTTGRREPIMQLSKPEWRNIIENYLLNIAVEAQCRFDFKHCCSEFKKSKQLEQQSNLKRPDMPPPSFIPHSRGSLLKKALMKNFQKSVNDGSAGPIRQGKVSLTKEEKARIWSECQARVYQRLGLDWMPDNCEASAGRC